MYNKETVNIGNGTIIGMGSIVTRDVPDYYHLYENLTRLIKWRFHDKQKIDQLLESQMVGMNRMK